MPVVTAPAVRETSGVSTSAPTYVFNNFPFPTPPRLNLYYNDFDTYAAGDWTVTGSGTSALTDGNGGLLLLTSTTVVADIQANQLTKKSFAFTTGSQVWYSINVSLGSATTSQFMAGLANDFSALAPTDGVYFNKPSGSAVLTAVIRAASTSTTITLNSNARTMVAATPYTLSFWYDGVGSIKFYTTIGLAANGFNAPGNGAGYYSGGSQIAGYASSETGATNSLANLPATSTNLVAGFALKVGTTGAQTGTVDYMLAAEEIVGRF